MDTNKIKELAFNLYENEEVAIELANVIFGIRDGDYDEEFTYPMYFKSVYGNIGKFTNIDTFEYLYNSDHPNKVGDIVNRATPHTDTSMWTPIAFDEDRGIWDKAVVRCWDNTEFAHESIKFYDAINKCAFSHDGRRNDYPYDSYEILENPSSRMLELHKTLED